MLLVWLSIATAIWPAASGLVGVNLSSTSRAG